MSDDEEMTAATVARLARLARLALPADEQERLAGELRAILGHVRALQQVDTTGVEPTSHGLLDRLPQRPDEVRPGLTALVALAQAPGQSTLAAQEPQDMFFRVPTFVDGADR